MMSIDGQVNIVFSDLATNKQFVVSMLMTLVMICLLHCVCVCVCVCVCGWVGGCKCVWVGGGWV